MEIIGTGKADNHELLWIVEIVANAPF